MRTHRDKPDSWMRSGCCGIAFSRCPNSFIAFSLHSLREAVGRINLLLHHCQASSFEGAHNAIDDGTRNMIDPYQSFNQQGSQMGCPYFKDFVRECSARISMVPEINTMFFCSTNAFCECPFYHLLQNIGPLCKYVKDCSLFHSLSIHNFDLFRTITKSYCLSLNCSSCRRNIVKSAGGDVPKNLMPDGSTCP